MNARFEKALAFVLKWECDYPARKDGDYSNDPDDPGGETRWGLDKASHPSLNVKTLTFDQAHEVYLNEYWTRRNCGGYNAPLDAVFFNAVVNVGFGRAIKLLGVSGKDPKRFIDEQEAFYKRLCDYWDSIGKRNPRKFLPGWLNRTQDLRSTFGLA